MTGHSEQLNELASALVGAQAALRVVEASSVASIEGNGEMRSYRYADLASIWAAVRKPLARHGLSVLQTCEPSSRGELRLTTTLLHESGQWISGTETVPVLVPTPQGYGSALTYARRYGMAAMLGVCVDDDDDGAVASKPMIRRQQASSAPASRKAPAARQRAAADAATTTSEDGALSTDAPETGWPVTPYNRATELDLKAFAKAYAEAQGLESVSSDDIRRHFGVQGRLVDHFGASPLGEIVESARLSGAPPAVRSRREAVEPPPAPDETATSRVG